MDAALIALWDRGVQFDYRGEPFRSRRDIPNEDINGVSFSGSDLRDADIEAILSLPNISSVSFSTPPKPGHALELVARLPELTQLILSGDAITDQFVVTLLRISTLEYLDVANTGITPDGIAELRKGMPDTTIHS